MTISNVWVAVALCALLAVSAGAAEIPLSRVVLFSSGVGYFEREGSIQGNATVELSFRTEQINDMLKSMVLQDFGGGVIAPVTYAPQDPLERTLSSFAVDISDNPRIAELWDRLRGTRVQVTAEQPQEGIVFGAEKQEKSVGDKVMTFDVLNLLTDKGMVQIPLWSVRSIKALDAKIDEDLRKALDAIDKARDASKRPVTLTFKGDGKRDVRIGYLLEMPVWKTSYRLVCDKDGLYLQGWAIVENTTDDDWNEVGLTLVSGRPVSFSMDLYEPLYIKRPVVKPMVAEAAKPQVYGSALEEKAAEREQQMAADAATTPPSPGMAGGFGGGMMARRAMAMAAPMAAAAAPPAENLALAATGAAAMAEGGKVGTLFRYAINQPVTVPRKRSAMIPIIGAEVEGEKVSVYNASADAKHPMNGIKLKNTSGLHLMGGPITVFDGGVYGGDALIEDVTPGEERLLTYAMDLAVEVEPQTKSAPEQLMAAKIVNGVLTLTHKQRTETTYVIKNSAKEKRTVLIEHPLRQDWKLVEPKEADERTRSVYRFKVSVDPDKTEKLLVAEEMPEAQVVQLARTNLDDVRLLIAQPQLSAELKAALQKLADLQAQLADITSKRTERETRIKDIDTEQNRIRQNMRELDRQSELYKQYVQKLTNQEAELDQLREEVRTLRADETAQKKAVADYVASLNV